MKNIFWTSLFVLFLSCPILAQAQPSVFISKIVRLSSQDCAVELEISANDQTFLSSDSIHFIDTSPVQNLTVATFTKVVDSGINNATTGNNDIGDKILAASFEFESDIGIDSDLPFSDSFCETLDPTLSSVGVFVQNAVNPNLNDVVDTIDLSAFSTFGNLSALVRESTDAIPVLLDLNTSCVNVQNNAGTVIGVGDCGVTTTGDGDGDSNINDPEGDGACSLNAHGVAGNSSSLQLFLLLAGMLATVRMAALPFKKNV